MALALYRKYRPRTFAEVIGQEHVTEPLSQALRSGRLHHAYLFSGPRGCGKTSSARILARSLNCEQGPTPEPCGVCASCRSLANDGAGSIDVIEIDAASHGGVDDARDLREKAFFAPASSRYKIYVIDEAHMVSPAGFNALLKLVEEPPDYVKFIFATTEPEKVLGTIRSRTHHYPFRLIPPAVLRPYLQQLTEAEGIHVEPAVFPLVVRAGGGSARDTLSVLDQLIAGAGPDGVSYARAVALLGVTDVTLIDEMCDAIAAGDGAAAYSTIDRVAEAGHDPRRFASDLLERFRDLIVLQQVPDAVAKGLIDGPADQLEAMSAQAGRLGPATLSRCADIVHNGLVEMRGTTAPRLLLELITARMLLPGADDSTGALLQRLERMERRLTLSGDIPAVREEPGAAASSAAAAPVAAARAVAASEPTGESGGGGASAGGGGGLSAARAAAAAASRRAAAPAAGRRPAASGAEPSAAVPASPVSSADADSAPQASPSVVSAVKASPPAVPAAQASPSVVPAAQAPPPAVPAAQAQASAEAPPSVAPVPELVSVSGESESVGSGSAVGEPGGYDEEPPPWDDEPDYEPAAEQTRPVPAARPAEPAAEQTRPVPAARPAEPAVAPVSAAPARRSEPAGLLPDAPEEPAAAAVADTPGQLTVSGVREIWPEVVAEVRKQPRGKVIGPMIADAVVRSLEGDTVVLVHQHDWAAARITQESALVINALYETLGGRWQIRCEVGSVEGGNGGGPSRGPARREPPSSAGRPPASEPSARAQTSTAPRAASGAQQAHAASARPPQARRQETESAGSSDDDWPEPARPGGLATPAVAPAAVDDEEEDWPEVRPIGSPTETSVATPQDGYTDTSAQRDAAARTGAPAWGDVSAASSKDAADATTHSAEAGGVVGSQAMSSGGVPVAGAVSGPDDRQIGQERPDGPAAAVAAPPAGATGPASVESAPRPAGPAPTSGPPAGAASAGGGPSAAVGGGASAAVGGGPSAAVGGGPSAAVGGGASAAVGGAPSAAAGGGASAAVGGGPSAALGGGSSAAAGGVTAGPAAGSAGAAAAARAARNAASGGGLAAARAAAAGARAAAAARQGAARPATSSAAPAAASSPAWADGSPTEEAPYDPEYDGPPRGGGSRFEGFDPGDEPLDDVIDEKTARESSEQQAMRLLQEVLGAEKIGES